MFFVDLKTTKCPFEINWPLGRILSNWHPLTFIAIALHLSFNQSSIQREESGNISSFAHPYSFFGICDCFCPSEIIEFKYILITFVMCFKATKICFFSSLFSWIIWPKSDKFLYLTEFTFKRAWLELNPSSTYSD